MKLTQLRGWLRGRARFTAAGICLILLLAGAAYYWHGFGLFSRPAPGGRAGDQIVQTAEASPESYTDSLQLLSQVIQGEAGEEPYEGKVAVGAVLLNRMQSSSFPHTLSGVVFQPDAFESVSNGLIWARQPTEETIRAATSALNGWDPSYGALYFWNPSKAVNTWVWSRQVVRQIGGHVFAR